MQNKKELKLLFVINPVSGGKNKNDWEQSIRDYFKNDPHHIEFYILTGNDDLSSVRHHINTIKPDTVVAVGGDGTVKMVAQLLLQTPYNLGIVPAGSANGMAKELNIPSDVVQSLDVIANGVSKKIDLIRINKDICIHLSDLGMNAMLVKDFEKSDKRGMWGYASALLNVLWNKRKIDATIKTDDKEITRKAYMIVIANARTYGTGAVINPEGDIADGCFEVVIIRRLSLWELFKMLISHKPFDASCIEVFHTKRLEIRTKAKAYFQVDGEYRDKVNEIQSQILPSVLNVMLPVNKLA